MSLRTAPALLLLGAALTLGCATPYQPYRAWGLGRGGYGDEPLGRGRHRITVQLNGYTDPSLARQHFERRAGELCARYEVEEFTEPGVGDIFFWWWPEPVTVPMDLYAAGTIRCR